MSETDHVAVYSVIYAGEMWIVHRIGAADSQHYNKRKAVELAVLCCLARVQDGGKAHLIVFRKDATVQTSRIYEPN